MTGGVGEADWGGSGAGKVFGRGGGKTFSWVAGAEMPTKQIQPNERFLGGNTPLAGHPQRDRCLNLMEQQVLGLVASDQTTWCMYPWVLRTFCSQWFF